MNEKDYKNNIDNMSDSELEERYSLNKRRMIGNNAFLGTITGISLFAYPPAALATLGVSVFRTYHISKNNKLLEKEANDRGMVLKKTRKK